MDDHRSARTWAGDRSIRPADMQTFGRQVGDGKEMGIHSYPVQLRYHISPSISFAFVLPLAPCASRFKFITHRNSSIWRTPVNFSQFQWHWLILRNDFQQVEAELFNYPTGISTAWGFRWKQTLFSFHSADPNWCCDGKPRPNLASNKPRWTNNHQNVTWQSDCETNKSGRMDVARKVGRCRILDFGFGQQQAVTDAYQYLHNNEAKIFFRPAYWKANKKFQSNQKLIVLPSRSRSTPAVSFSLSPFLSLAATFPRFLGWQLYFYGHALVIANCKSKTPSHTLPLSPAFNCR